MGVRTFICLSLEDQIREALKQWQIQLRAEYGDVFRWVAPDHMHVTLSFLGDVEVEQVSAVSDSVRRAVTDLSAFRMGLSSAGAFPHPGRPRVLWAGVGAGRAIVERLQGVVTTSLHEEHGFEPDRRKFHPHVTVARASRRGLPPDMQKALAETCSREWGAQWVERVDVMKSELRPGGPIYTVMASLPLAPGRRNC